MLIFPWGSVKILDVVSGEIKTSKHEIAQVTETIFTPLTICPFPHKRQNQDFGTSKSLIFKSIANHP